jgi:SAM-dependent methyltransferase
MDASVDARLMLGDIHGGRVLDVASGRGGFIAFLADGLADYDEIVGIELDEARRSGFEAATAGRRDIRFVHADFLNADLEPRSFDTVAVSASLHHFDDPTTVLRRMHELVRPGGWIVVSEMYRDGQTAEQLTEVEVHNWMAEVDTATGGVHLPTFRRSEIIGLVEHLGLEDISTTDRADLLIDPHDPATVAEIGDMIDRYAAKAAGIGGLEERANALRTRLARVGAREATVLTLVGRRPVD